MSIRQDQAQLIITIDAKESVEYQKAVQRSAELTRNIKKMEVGTDEYNAALREQAEISKRLGQTDYTKLSIKNLTDRKRALQEQIRILPQAQAAELGLERELQRVNSALAENSRRTRAVGQEMRTGSNAVRNLIGAYVGISSIIAFGKEVFAQIKKIDSLDKAYEKLIPDTYSLGKANAFVARLSEDYGIQINTLREEYIKYTAAAKASTLSLEDQELVFESVTKASSILGLSTETQSRAFTALQQIMSKGKVSAEELKGQLGDALPGAVTIMAKALGVGVGQLQKMLEKGEVMADVALPKFAIELQKAYGVDSVNRIDNIAAAQNRFSNTFTKVSESLGKTFGPVISRTFNLLSDYGKKLVELIDPTESAAEKTKKLQSEFNNEIGVLKRLSPEAQGRRDIIQQINEKYKDYLPNLLSETASIREIEVAQRAANKVFHEKLIFLAFEEEYKKQIDRTKEAIKQLAGAELSRARVAQENENLGNIGATGGQLEAQRKINEGFIGIVQKNAQEQIDNNDKVVAELETAYDAAAKRIGSTLDKIRKKFGQTSEPEKTKPIGATGSSSTDKKSKKENQYSEAPKTLTVPTLSKVDIDLREKTLLDMLAREQALLEESYLQGKVSQEEYELEKLRNLSASLATRIELYDAFGQKESAERRALNIEMLKVDQELIDARAALIVGDGADITALQEKFIQRLITEEEFNLARLNVERNYLLEKARLLEEAGLTETEVYKKLQEDLVANQLSYNKQKEDNEKRSAEIRQNIQREAVAVQGEVLDLAIDLLGKDEAARKKNASAIKSFESAKVLVSSISEIASTWKGATETLGPIAGPIFAAIKTFIIAGRAGLAISKINAQQFYDSGKVRPYNLKGSQKISVAPNIPTQEGGDNVLAVVKPGEVVLNKRHQEMAGGDAFFAKLGVPGFADSGVVRLPNTNPTGLTSSILSRNQATQVAAATSDPRIEMLAASLDRLTEMMPAALSNISAKVSYFDIKSKDDELNEIKQLARY